MITISILFSNVMIYGIILFGNSNTQDYILELDNEQYLFFLIIVFPDYECT